MAATPGRPSSRARHFDEFVAIAAGDADDDRRSDAGKIGQMMLDEGFEAVVVQADRVQHAGGGFDRSPRRIARSRQASDGFGNDRAEPLQIDQAGHLAGIAERARGHHDRIGQRQPAKLNCQINRHEFMCLTGGATARRCTSMNTLAVVAVREHTARAQKKTPRGVCRAAF